jgi:hypothetical protein
VEIDLTGPQGPAGGAGVRLVDANNVTLGYVLSFEFDGAVVVTSTGYVVQLYVFGGHHGSTIYATEIDGGGSLYGGIETLWGAIYVEATDSYYVVTSVDATGAAVEESNVAYQSRISDAIYNESDTLYSASQLTALSWAEVGLPQTIALPLTFE